jgi:hypothetical protein
MKPKCYISGAVTGLPIKHVKEKFKYAAGFIEIKGYEAINPMAFKHPKQKDRELTWVDYMALDIHLLLQCDTIFMLKDWGQSKGARIEHAIAKEIGLKVLYQGIYNE